MRTPTVKLEPTLTGPISGGPTWQGVIVEGEVTQTTALGRAMETLAPWMFSERGVPNASATRTHVFGGEATLLAEQPGEVG